MVDDPIVPNPARQRARFRLRTLPIADFRFEAALLLVQRQDIATMLAEPDLDVERRAVLAAERDYLDLELREAAEWQAVLDRAAAYAAMPGNPRRDIIDFRRIRETVDLPAVIERIAGVALTRSGDCWKCRCPLPGHNDRTPSFMVYPDGHFYCHGCHRYGDALHFVRDLFMLNSMRDALIELRRHFPEVA